MSGLWQKIQRQLLRYIIRVTKYLDWQNLQRQLLRHIIRVTKYLDCGKTYSDNCYVILYERLNILNVAKYRATVVTSYYTSD